MDKRELTFQANVFVNKIKQGLFICWYDQGMVSGDDRWRICNGTRDHNANYSMNYKDTREKGNKILANKDGDQVEKVLRITLILDSSNKVVDTKIVEIGENNYYSFYLGKDENENTKD